MNGLGRK